AAEVRIIADAGAEVPFGRRLERAIDDLPARRRSPGVVVLGSGAIPLAGARDLATFVEAAAGPGTTCLANNRYSGDIVAIPAAASLTRPVELAADNGLPRWLEANARCRVRALIEERGLRAAERTIAAQRPPRSVLGHLLDRDGPAALGLRIAELGDAAVLDSRVLLAHRFGADERSWPV